MHNDLEVVAIVRGLKAAKYRALSYITLDLIIWIGVAWLALKADHWWLTLPAVIFIGAVPMHNLLVYGHEGTHGLISRGQLVNAFFLWLIHALIGLSGTAYRVFHLTHHRYAHTDKDPEYRLLSSVIGGAPGWSYLFIPIISHLGVNLFPFREPCSALTRRRTLLDLAAAALLQTVLAVVVGIESYLLFIILPIFTSLSMVVAMRSLCEHHGTYMGSRWTNTRTINTNWLVELLWSNVNYHLEHHLFPTVPCHRLPIVHRLLSPRYVEHKSVIDRGYLRTAWALLQEPTHIKNREV
ncbi:MAG: fatty acid desaturase [Acidobacteriota bacterium]